MIELNVSGMSCSHCVNAITHAIQQQLPQATVHIDLASGRVRVDDIPDTDAIRTTLRSAISNEGYAVQAHA